MFFNLAIATTGANPLVIEYSFLFSTEKRESLENLSDKPGSYNTAPSF